MINNKNILHLVQLYPVFLNLVEPGRTILCNNTIANQFYHIHVHSITWRQ